MGERRVMEREERRDEGEKDMVGRSGTLGRKATLADSAHSNPL
jgi:hypothetical protein